MERDIDVEFEINPKLQALSEIMDGLSAKKQASKSKRSKPNKSSDQALLTTPVVAMESPAAEKKLLLIAVKTPKSSIDIQKFLIAKY